MSESFFDDFKLPEPNYNLGVGSGTHAEQTAKVMIEYEKLCLSEHPNWVVVVGDVNSTVACSLVAAKLHIPVAHLEAGLRSFDRHMPEEINRIVTDQLSDLLWTPSIDGNENLIKEGIGKEKINLVGNIMLDSFEMVRNKIENDNTLNNLKLEGIDFGVLTLHRPSNVDNPNQLEKIVHALLSISKLLTIVFPIHPRTKKKLNEFNLYALLENNDSVILCDPLRYIQFMNLVISSKLVITDSGGIQEETTYLGIPCFTLRKNTERPITITLGTNMLVESSNLKENVEKALKVDHIDHKCPELWDGKTANRIVKSLKEKALPS